MQTTLLLFPDYLPQGKRLAEALDLPWAEVELHRFPDGESRISLPAELPERVILVRSLDHPNDKLIELLLAAVTARRQGVRQLWLVAPYLCYMRQDIAFHPGEAVSQRIIGELLASHFDGVLTVDPHLHRIERLEQAFPGIQAQSLTAAGEVGRFLAAELECPLLLGPDSESLQWVSHAARAAGLDYAVADKQRHGDRDVTIHLPDYDYTGRHMVLVDDMVSTGQTLLEVARLLTEEGVASIHAMVTHVVGNGELVARLEEAGIRTLWSCDSVTHESNALSLAPLLARAIHRWISDEG